jgi:hypothetical protein
MVELAIAGTGRAEAAESGYGMKAVLARAFGTRLASDAHERAARLGLRLPLGAARKARLSAIREREILFIHVPKTAGMSVSSTLYGLQVKHASVRYYDHIDPDLRADLPSFAVMRDPIERFVSAYRYARGGGGRHSRVSIPFRRQYRDFRDVDDALDHVEGARSLFDIDHIFRPQSSYLLDAHHRIGVDAIVRFGAGIALGSQLKRCGIDALPWLNRSEKAALDLTEGQKARIRRLYTIDVALFEDWAVAPMERFTPPPPRALRSS